MVKSSPTSMSPLSIPSQRAPKQRSIPQKLKLAFMGMTAIPILVSTLLFSQVSQTILQDPLPESTPEQQIARLSRISYGIAGSVVVLSWIIVIPLANRWTRPFQKLVEYGRKASQWDVSQAVLIPQGDIFSPDEIGSLATYFRQILANSQQAYQQQESQLRLNTDLQIEQIEKDLKMLLDVMDAIESGNLNTKAPVSPGMIGFLADTFNRFIDHLSTLVTSIGITADRLKSEGIAVNASVHQAVATTTELTQLLQTIQTKLDPIMTLAEIVDHQIQNNKLSLQHTQTSLEEEDKVLNQLTEDLADLQGRFEQMQRRNQTLSDFVQLTSQFTRDQKRVAALTRVLALNASMLAARASGQEDPAQFASIAKEFETISNQVNDLALQTNQSLIVLTQRTEQIQTVVSGFTQEIETMGHQVNQISQGSNYSRQWLTQLQTATQERLDHEFQPTQTVTQLVQKILESTEPVTIQQQQRAEEMRRIQAQVSQIATLTTTLVDSLQQFERSQSLISTNTRPENGHGSAKTLPQPLHMSL